MDFFIDTANLDEIKQAHDLGILDGVTTNPSLMAKENIVGQTKIEDHYKQICDIVDGPVSAEVIATTYNQIIDEGSRLASLHENIVVKVPMIPDGIKAIRYFCNQDIETNCTLVFSAGQAILAAKAGATYVSPFLGRLDDISTNSFNLISDMVEIYEHQSYSSAILAASIRHPIHIVEATRLGADIITCPLKTILALFNHPLTDLGLEKFLNDAQKMS